LEEQGTDAPSSVGDDAPSVGGDDGGGYSDDAAAANQSVTPSYSTAGVGLGRDTYSQVDAMKGALGITPTNPFGYKSPFSGFTDALGISLDYSNIFSNPDMDAIAQKNVDVYSNPNNNPSLAGYDPTQPANQPRSGIQRGFGSLFNPIGQQTAFGKIAAQRPNDPMGSLAIGAFSNLAGFGLPSIMAQAIGRDTYAAKGTPGYNPTIDPASPSFTGPSSMGGIVDTLSMLGTGMTSTTAQEVYGATKEAVEEAISYFSNPKGGSDITSTNTVTSVSTTNAPTTMSSGTALGKSPTVGIETLEPMGSSNNMFSPQGYSTTVTTPNFDLPGFSSRSMSKEEAEDIQSRLGY
jgi:hypothetical protein